MKFLLKFKEIVYIIFIASLFLLGSSSYAEEEVTLDVIYVDGPLAGQTPEGGLEPQVKVALVAAFSGSAELCQSGYKLFHTMVHAKNGDLSQREYLAKGEGDDVGFEFNSGPSGQKNVYWPVFFCWSSNLPEVALGTAKQWTSSQRFDQDTVGGRCNLSNPSWSSTSVNVGEDVDVSVDGTLGCKGRDFTFELWRGGRALFSRIETTINATFPNQGSGPFTVIKRWKVTSDNNYLFKARVPDPNGDLAVSGEISPGRGGGGGGSTEKSVLLEFKNPLAAENFNELIDALLSWIFWLSIPIAVIMIIYSGIQILLSGGDPTKVTKGKKILLWVVVGLAAIFIGRGFIALIESILNLKN